MVAFDGRRRCPECGAALAWSDSTTNETECCLCRDTRYTLAVNRRAAEDKAARMEILRQREEWLKRKGDRALRKGQR